MESTYEKRFRLNKLDTFNKMECEETLMLLRYLYRREEDLDLRVEMRFSMDRLEIRIKELSFTEPEG
jgi:hypothetical protein